MSSQYGCGRVLVIKLLNNNELRTSCGFHHEGEVLQCEDCQESKPLPPSSDEDAAAERALELEHPAGVPDSELLKRSTDA